VKCLMCGHKAKLVRRVRNSPGYWRCMKPCGFTWGYDKHEFHVHHWYRVSYPVPRHIWCPKELLMVVGEI